MSFSARSDPLIRERPDSSPSTSSTKRGRRTGNTSDLRTPLVRRCGNAIRRRGGSGTDDSLPKVGPRKVVRPSGAEASASAFEGGHATGPGLIDDVGDREYSFDAG